MCLNGSDDYSMISVKGPKRYWEQKTHLSSGLLTQADKECVTKMSPVSARRQHSENSENSWSKTD